MAIKVVAVDSGRSNTKMVTHGYREYFKSIIGEYRELKNDRFLGKGDMVVEFNGEKYFVGGIAEESHGGAQMFLQSKVHPDTKLITAIALHRAVDDSDGVFLITGQPIDNHTPVEKLRLKQLLLGDYTIKVNGETKSFHVARVEVATEGATAGWALKRKGNFLIVDIGSRTVNFATMINGKWMDRLSGNLDYGYETLPVTKPMFARTTIAELTRRLRQLPRIVLIGGIAEEMLPYFKEYTEDIELHHDPLFANANAFFDLGVLALETAKAQ